VIALEAGSTLGGYRILARIRAGAMGVLYVARRIGPAGFSRPVAIKVIHDHLAQNKRFARMFIDEAKLSARIDDPNVVRVEEFGQADGRYYLVMEYVHGVSLAQAIGMLRNAGGIPVEHAVQIAMQIAGGLHGAHEATDEDGTPLGIVHRDVSPHNILVSYKGSVRIIDFGIAKARQVGGQTKTGSLRGKLAYMPPEQARSARTVDRRADLYGVGLVLWEMLTMRRVFDAETDIAILNQIRDPQIVPPSTLVRGIPKALDDILLKTLANDPAERPPTGAALQRALADAVPGALRVFPMDLAALMAKVRGVATTVAERADDPSASYGEEVKRSESVFGRTMHESVESVGATRPSGHDLEDDATAALSGPVVGPPSSARPVVVMPPQPAFVVEDEATKKRQAPARPSGPAGFVRPSDGVRPLAPSLPAIPQGPVSHPDLGAVPPAPPPEPAPPLAFVRKLSPGQRLALAAVLPVLAGGGLAFAILSSGDPAPKAAAAATPHDAAPAIASTPSPPEQRPAAVPVPVVIAPEPAVDPSAEAAAAASASAAASARKRPGAAKR